MISPLLGSFSVPFFAWWLFFVLSPPQTGGPPSEHGRRTDDSISRQAQEPGETTLYFPDYVDGGGWSVQLVLSNVDPEAAAEVQVDVYDPDGQPVLDLFDSDLTLEIPSQGSRVLRSAGGETIRRGWIEVRTGSAAVSGLLTYRDTQSGIEVGVKPVELGSRFALFVEETPSVGAGVAVYKTDAAARVELRIRNEEGHDPLEGGVVRWGDFRQAARTLPEWFAGEGVDTEFLRDFRGLLFLETEDESPFAPLGLRFGKRTSSLSAVPVIRIQSQEPQEAALRALYEATGGDNWNRNENWLTDAPLDEWYGVDVTGTGRVVALSLSSNNLKGHLPPEIGRLSSLESLDLHRNWRPGPSSTGLTGRIPPEIGKLSNLSDLNLSSNELIGTIPTELGELTNLVRLDVGYNDLTGRIPIELTELPSLAVFDLGSNNLTGSIPPEIGAMTTLTRLDLGGNGLSGGIPRELGNLSLTSLDLGYNNLTGRIPPEIGDITSLLTLILWNNRLTGPIPEELGNLGRLINLMLNDNLLTGPVPESLLQLRLFSFRAANNTSVCIPDTPEFAAWVSRLTQYDEPPLCTGQ